MPDRRCCCLLASCTIFTDSFTRDDSDDPGSDWNEVSGDWDISGNALVETGNAGAIVVCTTPNPRSGRGHVNTTIEPVNGDKYRIILNSNAAGSGYLYVEAECSTASVILKAGGETRTYTSADGWDITVRPMTFQGCVDEGLLRVDLFHLGFDGAVWDNSASIDNTRRYAGLMNGDTSPLTYNDFTYSHHVRDGLADPPCLPCGCHCVQDDGSWWYVGWQLTLTFYSDDCPIGCCCFNEEVVNLEYNAEEDRWQAVSGSVCGHSMPFDESPYEGMFLPLIYCGDSVRCDWLMTMFECCAANSQGAGCDEPPDQCTRLGADTFTCGPFAVRWNFPVPYGDLTCEHCGFENPGSYYAILTEP
jgi:hypothetical protein